MRTAKIVMLSISVLRSKAVEETDEPTADAEESYACRKPDQIHVSFLLDWSARCGLVDGKLYRWN
jgi:hypothetical protein